MKKTIFAFVLAALASLSTLTAGAQTSFTSGKATVPFAFNYGNRHFEPGAYRLAVVNEHTLMIRGANGLAMAMYQGELTRRPSTVSKAVFRKIGGRYYLTEIWEARSESYVSMVETRQQKEAERERETASAVNDLGRVEVALTETAAQGVGN